ncbi:hypothetical protein ACFX15_000650 [Malus domestica]
MASNSILCCSSHLNPSLFVVVFCLFVHCYSYGEQGPYSSFTVSSFSYPPTTIGPSGFRYIRVEMPPWFSSIAMNSNVELAAGDIEKVPKVELPLICFRAGSLPLPDVNTSLVNSAVLAPLYNGSYKGIQALQSSQQCYPMQKNFTLKLTNEQISPGVWYFGLFNGIGPTRTQSKMINRAPSYSFSANITVEGCTTLTMWGPGCNQTINTLSCAQSNSYSAADNSSEAVGVSHELKILAKDVWLNVTSSDNTKNVGRWYITVLPLNVSKELEGSLDTDTKVCYSLESKLLECPEGKAGANCTWEMYTLQTSLRKGSSYFEYYYLLISEKVPPESANFPLDHLLTNSSHGGQPEETWTYFVMDIPRGAAGGHMHIQLNSDDKVNYEVYARYGGLPSLASWDYFYSNRTSSSHGSMFFNLYNSSEDKVDFYILYIREGTWGFGLKHLNTTSDASKVPTIMSVSLERCPRRCSSHGKCETALDASGLASYSFCSCDPDHGGFDCSIELVTPHGHVWQSIFLIASNAAAALPAFWALRQKALAEWVIFTSSGIASGIYHACDVGTWCPLGFGVLQFMDVWLSFMAVGSTFVYLGTVEDDLKRALHTAVALLTALMVYTKARRPGNIILVIVIGTIALLIGWLIELSTKFRSFSFSTRFSLNMLERLQAVNGWLKNLIKTTFRRFRWGFILAGLVALAIAASSWVLETNESYWIWHSIWHMTIYTSSFFFLCSKESPASTVDTENQIPPNGAYELTRQDSFSRGSRVRDLGAASP